MIGEYLDSVRGEVEAKMPDFTDRTVSSWVVDDCFMPRDPVEGEIRAILEAVVGDPVEDDKRVWNEERVQLLSCDTTMRLETLIDDPDAPNPHTTMMTIGAKALNWIKDASFAYQADICEPVGVSSEIDVVNVGFSVVMVRWRAQVVSDWPAEVEKPRISEVRLNVRASLPDGILRGTESVDLPPRT